MKKLSILSLIIIVLAVIAGIVWFFWGRDYFKEFQRQSEVRSRVLGNEIPGYVEEKVKTEEEGVLETTYKVSGHEEESVERVVENVAVKVVDYTTPGEAQKQIEEASLVYIWEWRKEKIGGQEVHTGYLRNREQTRYEAAYLAWVEEATYFELIARPNELRDFSDKEFLYQSVKEVARSILNEDQ